MRRLVLMLVLTVAIASLMLLTGASGRGLLMSALAGALAFPAALIGAVRASGAQRRDFLTLWPWAALFTILVFLVSATVNLLAGHDPVWLGPAVGWGVAVCVYVLAIALWLAPLRPIFKLRSSLADPKQVDQLAAELVASFEGRAVPQRGIPARRHAVRALAAVRVLAEALRYDDADRVLRTVPAAGLTKPLRAALAASQANVRLYLHDKNGAWAALKEAFALAEDPVLLNALKLTDALCSALDRRGEEALARLPEQRPEDPRFVPAWLLARAHALAALDRHDEARHCLTQLSQLGPRTIARAQLLKGPASALAAELSHE